MESVDAAALAADLRSSGSYTQGLEAAAAVACPALLILGRRDQMTPARNAEPLIEALRDVSSVTIPDAGHMMMVEDPNRVIDETLAFLATVEA